MAHPKKHLMCPECGGSTWTTNYVHSIDGVCSRCGVDRQPLNDIDVKDLDKVNATRARASRLLEEARTRHMQVLERVKERAQRDPNYKPPVEPEPVSVAAYLSGKKT